VSRRDLGLERWIKKETMTVLTLTFLA